MAQRRIERMTKRDRACGLGLTVALGYGAAKGRTREYHYVVGDGRRPTGHPSYLSAEHGAYLFEYQRVIKRVGTIDASD
jgi:hypothetical protein